MKKQITGILLNADKYQHFILVQLNAVFKKLEKVDFSRSPNEGRNSGLPARGLPAPGLSGPERPHDPCSYHLQ